MKEKCGGRLGMWRGALLGSVSLVAMACSSDALAACQGVNTGNVLCDAAHPATGGQLTTQSNADTTVNINAGAGITAGLLVTSGGTPNQSLTINHNDPGGIRNTGMEAILIYNFSPDGAVTYTGSADVVGPLSVKSSGGPVSVTQTAGTVTSIAVETSASGSVDINTVGSRVGGIFARNIGTAGLSDFTIRSGEISAADASQYAVYAQVRNSFSPSGRNLSVTIEGNVLGYIYMSSQGTGIVDLTTNGTVTGTISVEATNQASNGAFTVNLNQDVTGGVALSNYGTGSATVHTGNIAGTFAVYSVGANNSVVVDGNVAIGTVASATNYSGTLASINLGGGGSNSATFNGAISGTFDASGATHATSNGRVTGLAAGLGSSSSAGSATLNANGPITVTGISRPGDAANVTGVSLSANGSVVPFDVNLRGAVTATSIGDTAATVFGITPRNPNSARSG